MSSRSPGGPTGMGSSTLQPAGVERIHRAVARHVGAGAVPGAIWLVARDGEIHAEVLGHADLERTRPLGRDALFRISSMTKPMTAVVALSCVEDGLFRLDEPVDRLLPELA